MAKKFVLTAILSLQAPASSNISSVVNAINRSLKGITASVNVNISASSQAQLTKLSNSMKRVQTATSDTTSELEKFGKQSAIALRRFAAFSVATAGFVGLASAMKNSFAEAIKFDREIIRISQVTGTSVKGLKDLKDEISRLSTTFGISSEKIAAVAVTLSQAGLTALETKQALEVLAKTELSATFENLTDTTEAAIAVMGQFGLSVKDLKQTMSSINNVAKSFAVEAGDITKAVRISGGAFHAAGANFEEFEAVLTSVRHTTRKSAESIATGLRTIVARMERPKTIDYLKTLGIELRDLNGQFIGPYEGLRKLNAAFRDVPTTDTRFSLVAEELGGFRQIDTTVAAIKNFTVAEKARNIAMKDGDSVTENAIQAQQSLAVQINRVREEFNALFRVIVDDKGVRAFIDMTLQMSSALIKLAESITPLLPLLVSFGTVKLASAATTFGKAFMGHTKKFATGGIVPGTGSGDTVPAMLTPGEYVLNKNTVQRLGIGKVQHFAGGGLVKAAQNNPGTAIAIGSVFASSLGSVGGFGDKVNWVTAQLGSLGLQVILFSTMLKSITTNKFAGSRGFGSQDYYNDQRMTFKRQQIHYNNLATNASDPFQAGLYRMKAQEANTNRMAMKGPAARAGRIQLASSIAGAAGMLGGSLLSDYGNSQIKSGRGGRVASGLGGTLSGAAQGGLIGSIAGPWGAAAGALIGGAVGMASALKDASSKIKDIKFDEDIKQSGEKIKHAIVTGSIDSEIKRLYKESQTAKSSGKSFSSWDRGPIGVMSGDKVNEFSPEDIKEKIIKYSENLSDIEKLMESIRSDTRITSLEEFNKKAAPLMEAQETAGGTKRITEEANMAKIFEGRNNKLIGDKVARELEAKTSSRLKFIDTIASVFETLNHSVDKLNNSFESMDSTISGRSGASKYSNGAGVFGDLQNVTDKGRLSNNVNLLKDILHSEQGNLLGDEVSITAMAGKMLPELLRKYSGEMGNKGEIHENVADALTKQLKGLGSKEAIHSIVSDIENHLEQVAGEDRASFSKKVRTDSVGISRTIIDKSNPVKVAKDILDKFTDMLNEEGKAQVKRRELQSKITENIANTLEAITQKDEMILSWQDKRLSLAQISNVDMSNPNRYGYTSANKAASDAITEQSNIRKFTEQRDNFSGPDALEGRLKLTDAIEKSKEKFDEASSALNFFANASKRATLVQNELSKLQDERRNRLGILKKAAFGTPQEQIKLFQTAVNANQVANNPKSFGKLPTGFQKDIIDLLDELGDNKFGNTTGTQLSKKLLASIGINEGSPGKAEKEVQNKLIAIADEQVIALRAQTNITKSVYNQTTELIAALRDVTITMGGTITKASSDISNNQAYNLIRTAGFANGGLNPKDTIPAMLSPGEFVMRPEAVRSIGLDNLYAMNNAQGFAGGGYINGRFTRGLSQDQQMKNSLLGKGIPRSYRSHNPSSSIDDSIDRMTNPDFPQPRDRGFAYDENGNKVIISGNLVNRSWRDRNPAKAAGMKANRLTEPGSGLPNQRVVKKLIPGARPTETWPSDVGHGIRLDSAQSAAAFNMGMSPTDYYYKYVHQTNYVKGLKGGSSTSANTLSVYGDTRDRQAFSVGIRTSVNKGKIPTPIGPRYNVSGISPPGVSARKVGIASRGIMQAANIDALNSMFTGRDTLAELQSSNNAYIRKTKAASKQNFYAGTKGRSRRGYAEGGLVGGGSNSSINNDFNRSIEMFSNTAKSLIKVMESFPHTLELKADHKVEVIFNGAEVLNGLIPAIKKIAIHESTRAINKMIEKKMPDIGPVQHIGYSDDAH